jgi:hypothetical protein
MSYGMYNKNFNGHHPFIINITCFNLKVVKIFKFGLKKLPLMYRPEKRQSSKREYVSWRKSYKIDWDKFICTAEKRGWYLQRKNGGETFYGSPYF